MPEGISGRFQPPFAGRACTVNLDQYNQYMSWITAHTACQRLAIKRQSLYAYVSRGLIRARAHAADPRQSLYAEDDVAQLQARRRAGRTRSAIAQSAIGWGEPVMDSAIATVRDGRLIYRGQDAIHLSEHARLEDVASLLWGDPLADVIPDAPSVADGKAAGFAFLAHEASFALPSKGQNSKGLTHDAAHLLHGLSSALAHGHKGQAAHMRLAACWQLNAAQADIIRRALVLLADHELNPSTFAARVAASTGASLAACALAGYATLTGPDHGQAAAQALAYLRDAHSLGPKGAMAALLERGQVCAGLGHRLYPAGDPRAAALLRALKPYPILSEAIQRAQDGAGQPANIDLALACLTVQLGLDPAAPFILFATARMAGWLAHAREQVQSGLPIRPRAVYRDSR